MAIISILFSTYIVASILKPLEIIDTTAQFISLLLAKPPATVSQLGNTLVLTVGFIVLYHLIAIHCILDFVQLFTAKAPVPKKKQIITPKKKVNVPKVVVEKHVDLTTTPVPEIQKPKVQPESIVQKAPVVDQKAPLDQENQESFKPSVQENLKPIVHKGLKPIVQQKEPKEELIEHPIIHNDEVSVVQEAETEKNKETKPVIEEPTVAATPAPIVPDSPIPASINISPPHHNEVVAVGNQLMTEEENKVAHVDDTVLPPTERPESIKEQYYNELLKKDSNIMSLSDNLQRIFDEPASSPDTPALTPPHPSTSSAAGSTVSRKSSLASQHSQFKSRLQVAMQKVAKPKAADEKKRFSLISNSNRKSKVMDSDVVVDVVAPKRSISTKFQKGLKNTGKRFSKIFS